MLASCIPIQCVNVYQQDITRVEFFRILAGLYHDKTSPVSLKKKVVSYFQQMSPVCTIESFYTPDRQKMTASVLIGSVLIATVSLKLFDPYILFSSVRKYPPLSQKKIFNTVLKRRNQIA